MLHLAYILKYYLNHLTKRKTQLYKLQNYSFCNEQLQSWVAILASFDGA